VLIHDDASTDKTAEIVREYELKYPKLIKGYYQKENTYRKSDKYELRKAFMDLKIGKYEALCEGDDYWIDPLKLQKQVGFLEANSEYALCVGGYTSRKQSSGNEETIIHLPLQKKVFSNGFAFTLDDTKNRWLTKTLTAVFRADSELITNMNQYKYGRDVNLFYHILKKGNGFYFGEIFGIYNIHEGGVNSMKHGLINTLASYNIRKELYQINRDEWTRSSYLKSALAFFNFNLYNTYDGNTYKKNYKIYFETFKLVNSFKDLILLFTNLLSPTFKSMLRSWASLL
jgi:glycosyltransferase involved in cell wall biosynthesis